MMTVMNAKLNAVIEENFRLQEKLKEAEEVYRKSELDLLERWSRMCDEELLESIKKIVSRYEKGELE